MPLHTFGLNGINNETALSFLIEISHSKPPQEGIAQDAVKSSDFAKLKKRIAKNNKTIKDVYAKFSEKPGASEQIESKSSQPEFNLLCSLVIDGLSSAFDVVGIPGGDRLQLAKDIAKAILARSSRTELSSPIVLPTEAPELYSGLRGPETPPEFVERVYGQWLGKGLTRATIRTLDPTLYQAIVNWSRKNEWPIEVDLPTLKEQNSRDIARLSQGSGKDVLGKFTGKEAARLGAAIARRTI